MSKRFKIVLYTFLITGSLFFVITGLIKGKSFLIPLVTAIVLGMVVFPVAKKLREWGMKWSLAVLLADLVIVLFITLMVFLFAAQGNKIINNWSQIESRLKPKIERVQNFMTTKLNMPRSVNGQSSEGNQHEQSEKGASGEDKQQSGQPSGGNKQQDQARLQGASTKLQTSQQQGGTGAISVMSELKNVIPSALKGIFGFMGDMLLVLVYIFFFLFYFEKFQDAVKGMASEDNREKAGMILSESAVTAQKYLFGRFLLIIILAILYLVTFSIIGLKYAVFISVLAALFSLLPYIGNVIGLVLAIGMSSLSGGGSGQVIGIVIAFSVIQFIESYALEPFVVGKKVNINPVITIVGVVLGGIIWGVMGMLLAIPIIGILKVVLDNIETLRPLGYFLDERDIDNGNSIFEKLKNWFKK